MSVHADGFLRPLYLIILAGTVFSALAQAAADPFATDALTASHAAGKHAPAAPTPCAPLGQEALSLENVIDRALCHNPQTRQAWAGARAQAAAVGSARAQYLPQADLAFATRRQRSSAQDDSRSSTQTGASLTLSYLLYDFGGRSASLESARQRLHALNASHEDAVQSVFLAAVQAFYQWHAYQAALDAADSAKTAAQESLNAAHARYEVGTATPLDRLQAQSALSQAVLNRVRAQGDLDNGRARLINIMGLAPQSAFTLARPTVPHVAQLPAAELELLMTRAQAARPDLMAAESQWRAALAAVDLAKAQGKPSISFSAGQDWGHNSLTGSSDGLSAGISINVPLFSGFVDTYRVRAAQAEAEAGQYNRERVAQLVSLEVAQSFNALNTNAQAVEASRDVVDSAEEALRVASGRYRAGVGTMLDLLSAQNTLSSARFQRIQAEYDWSVARYSLARSIGRIDASLLHDAALAEGTPLR